MNFTHTRLDQRRINSVINKYQIDAGKILLHIDEMINVMDIKDIDSIGKKDATNLAIQFENYIKGIEGGTVDITPCFWCCKEGRTKALLETQFVTDSGYPIIKLLFEYCTLIKEQVGKREKYMTLLSFGISRLFASYAKRDVPQDIHVFMSSDKSIENTGFHIGNNFWMAELPVLHDFLRNNYITDIILHICEKGQWSHDLSIKHDIINLPLWRRKWHPLDGKSTIKSYVDDNFTQNEWDQWRKEPPRKFTTYSKMLNIAYKWKNMAISKTL